MFKSLIDLFFPHVCAGCNSLLRLSERTLCSSCRHQLPLTNHFLRADNEVSEKFYGRLPVVHASAMCYFQRQGIVRNMIHKLKYQGNHAVGETLGLWYASILKEAQFPHVVTVVPVPLHKRRLRQRGYNQVESFAKALARGLGQDYEPAVLTREVYARTQTRKDRARRPLAAKRMFRANASVKLQNTHFLLVDDVITTGSTLEACGKALLEIPGAQVSVVCIGFSNS